MKQKVELLNWAYDGMADLEALGFSRPDPQEMPRYHGLYEVTDKEKWAMIKKLYDAGFNVQLRHDRSGATNVQMILVDIRGFNIR